MPLKIPVAAAMIVFASSVVPAQEPPRKPPVPPAEPQELRPKIGDRLDGPGLGQELVLPSRPKDQPRPDKKDKQKP